MSVVGTKRTLISLLGMSALWGKADIGALRPDALFTCSILKNEHTELEVRNLDWVKSLNPRRKGPREAQGPSPFVIRLRLYYWPAGVPFMSLVVSAAAL